MVTLRGVRRIENRLAFPLAGELCRVRGPRKGAPYWQERGWARSNGYLLGRYRAGRSEFDGRVDGNGQVFMIRHPPRELRSHGHWACFRPQPNGWFTVHFTTVPSDVSSGIMKIERILSEALPKHSGSKRARTATAERGPEGHAFEESESGWRFIWNLLRDQVRDVIVARQSER
jgi:hypothetical protein